MAIEDVLNKSAAEARRRFEIPVLVAALLVVPVIFIEEQADSVTWLRVAEGVNWLIWLAFAAEYFTVAWLTDRRWAYTRKAWLDVFIIVSSFPLLPGLLASTRLLRLLRLGRVLRLLRLARLTAVITRGVSATRTIFAKRGLGYIIIVSLLVAMGIGGVFAVLEGSALSDGLWWAIVTMTTVGYGDFFPTTLGGRIAAAVLMILGIGLLAIITASVAAHFFEDDDKDADQLADDVARLHERLNAIEQLLRAKKSASEEDV